MIDLKRESLEIMKRITRKSLDMTCSEIESLARRYADGKLDEAAPLAAGACPRGSGFANHEQIFATYKSNQPTTEWPDNKMN